MAAGSLLTLLDDIALILDDVAVLSKRAAVKTAGVLGDDLALNAEQVSGVRAEREIPVVWAVAKGSFLNKFILVPAALAISAILPWLIVPLLMCGGLFLCFEGVEKLLHRYLHPQEKQAHDAKLHEALLKPKADLVALEKQKIRGAIRTDFILSAEIIVIALGTVQDADFLTRTLVVTTIAFMITFVVYGLVAGIVKLDDAGLHLLKQEASAIKQRIGGWILWFAPVLMKGLSVLGTLAMFLVGGGILVHGIPLLATFGHDAAHLGEALPGVGFLAGLLAGAFFNAVVGVVAGAAAVAAVTLFTRLRGPSAPSA